jgi:hypothetical protein
MDAQTFCCNSCNHRWLVALADRQPPRFGRDRNTGSKTEPES